jgi:3-oxosteroid 1-dehydrogenase
LLDKPDDRDLAKAHAFIETAPAMARQLADEGIRWIRSRTHPDYYPHVAGNGIGRTLESAEFDGTILGERFATMRQAGLDVPALTSDQFGSVALAKSRLGPMIETLGTVGRYKLKRLVGRKPLGNGRALVAALMKIAMDRGIELHLSTRMVELVEDHSAITGVIVECGGRRQTLAAPAGVVLTAGGFSRSAALRRQHQGREHVWPNAIPEDEGDALAAGLAIGASHERTDDCWWMPSIEIDEGSNALALGLRALPGSIVVNPEGRRYMNEAAAYMTTGRVMFENGAATSRHWLIMDGRFLKRYVFAELSQRHVREAMLAQGTLKRADTVAQLAAQCGLPGEALEATVAQFNGFAKAGHDADFARGDTAYDRHWADPAHRPNPSLGAIETPPYWAALIRPGDLGTNGGLRTDEWARVLDTAGRPITGLYAAGNSASSPFGRSYPGAGATIAAAATFGHIAATHAARRYSNA